MKADLTHPASKLSKTSL